MSEPFTPPKHKMIPSISVNAAFYYIERACPYDAQRTTSSAFYQEISRLPEYGVVFAFTTDITAELFLRILHKIVGDDADSVIPRIIGFMCGDRVATHETLDRMWARIEGEDADSVS